ncbi:MAG TPA: response regulator transcription factor [Anaerolineales bacterium]|jgi:DNA-binding NarL/FixJ family response regulator|nr:response regulator transcription factor [Anaerolineales bacterium]|tara:strand:- start:640 stop:1317 length:678 start_codon:yes stop_codon:yes gene_type:complete
MSKARVMLVDNHDLFRDGIASLLAAQSDMEVVGEAGDGLEAVQMARRLQPDLILMDLMMPVSNGLEATTLVKQELPETIVVILTVVEEDEKLFEAIKAGAQGYLLKDTGAPEFLAYLRGALSGEAALSPALAGRILLEFARLSKQATSRLSSNQPGEPLTPREQEVLALVAEGDRNAQISTTLNISLNTVKSHVRSILGKLHVPNRRQAAAYAVRDRLQQGERKM